MAQKSKKDNPSNKSYKAESRWIKNKDLRQERHQKRLQRKDAHMKRRMRAGKTTPADIRWQRRQEQDQI